MDVNRDLPTEAELAKDRQLLEESAAELKRFDEALKRSRQFNKTTRESIDEARDDLCEDYGRPRQD